jgi:hypothetical protein
MANRLTAKTVAAVEPQDDEEIARRFGRAPERRRRPPQLSKISVVSISMPKPAMPT